MSHKMRDLAVFAVAAAVLLAGVAGAIAVGDARHASAPPKAPQAVATTDTPVPLHVHSNPFSHQAISPQPAPQPYHVTRTRTS
jgi:hypothetical protein